MAQTAISEMPAAPGKRLNITLWVLQILTAVAFLGAGGAKLAGVPEMVETFEKVGVGQWFRFVTGSLEIIGAVALLIPGYAFRGAALLATIMVGAVIAQLALIHGSPGPAIVFLLSTGTIAYFRRPRNQR